MSHLRGIAVYGVLVAIVLTWPVAVMSQSRGQPVDIAADDSLKWDQKRKILTAHGRALVQQGDVSMKAGTIHASYRETGKAGSRFSFHTLEALDDVVLRSVPHTAYGQRALYFVDRGYAELTGAGLRIESPGQTVTASDKFQYDVKAGRFKAIGSAKLVRPDDQLQADILIAELDGVDGVAGGVRRVVAQGNVVISTRAEQVRGAYGVYDAQAQTVVLSGGVVVRRGQTELRGQRAHVDLKTQVSQIFATTQQGEMKGRVSGRFYPGEIGDSGTEEVEAVVPADQ